jgi:hypothetical protein
MRATHPRVLAVMAGIVVGIAYAGSPLTIWFALAAWALMKWAAHDLPSDERALLRGLLAAALLIRVLAVAALFVVTDHAQVPFATFVGDEAFFIRRSIWLRNIALGIPTHAADLIYAYDEVGKTSYTYLLAAVQVLVGPSPYGVHLISIASYLTAAVLLFRLVRRTLGPATAFAGLLPILFLPSLMVWSVGALKEPVFFLLASSSIVLVERLVRSPSWGRRALLFAAAVALTAAVQSLREGGAAIVGSTVAVGLLVGWSIRHPRMLLAAAIVLPVAAGAALSQPRVQLELYRGVQRTARYHTGHISTPGYVYKTLDDRFYQSAAALDDMRFPEAARFVVRSIRDYVLVPVPWQVQSRSALAHIPEQIVWYLLIVLAPFGFVYAVRRDVLVTMLFLAHALAAALVVALTSGNVGTLVRHRGMALPYLVWMSAAGVCELSARWAQRARSIER